ncbi:cucumber peeling cupredoxin-like [Cucurbita moschata]|uniref:Cucumber peeling cupredoxin-like n=1 Tax=Cucurbita moschata TaxID=3662 RepID=A0A6J1EW61_CUCMO|nr:cucumber peeling cupredoxin-like [Cucurbita moschata]
MSRITGSVGSVACLLFIGTLLPVIVAVDHEVGGDFGWNLPPMLTFFSKWARNTTFFVGDRLKFIPRANETHTYTEAESQKDYDGCIEQGIVFDSTIILTLHNPPRRRYFVCTDGNHCNNGMKFSIDVLPKATTTPNMALKIDVFPLLLFITIMANMFFV